MGARLETATKEFSSKKKLTKENLNNDATQAAEEFVQKFNLSSEQLQQLLLLAKNKLQESGLNPTMDDFITQDMIGDFADGIRKYGESFLDYLKQKAQDLAKKLGFFTDAEKAQIINKVFESLEEPKILFILDLAGIVEVTPDYEFSIGFDATEEPDEEIDTRD